MPKSPQTLPAQPAANQITAGGGEMGERIRNFDWKTTGLGPLERWPQSLITSVNILLHSPVPLVIFWGKDGIMLYNDAYSIFAGGRHPQLLGSKVVEGWPEVADFNRNVMKHCLRGEALSYEDRQLTLYRTGEPEAVWMNLNYSPIIGESGKPAGVLAIVIETTKQVQAEARERQAEQALHEERERLRLLFLQAPALIAVLRGPNHTFEMANPMYMQTVAPRRKIIGRPIKEALPELAGQGITEILDEVLHANKPYSGVLPVKLDRTGTGQLEEAYFNVVYQPIGPAPNQPPDGIFVHAVEITEQVVSRRRAERLNAQLEAVFESIPDGLYIADRHKIIRINQRGAEALGYRSPEDVPRSIEQLYEELRVKHIASGKELKANDSTLGNALLGKTVQHHGIRVINPLTGAQQILRTAGAPIKNRHGEVVGAVAINNDLTELYSLQEKMQQQTMQRRLLAQKARLLREQNKELMKLNTTKDEFIALTSHQLRTPATGVKQYVAMLLQGYAGPVTPDQEQFLERAYESNERQLQIIDDILRVARIDMGKVKIRHENLDLREVVQRIIDEQANRFQEREQQVVTRFPAKPVMLQADKTQLHMAIGNIIDNASKYTPNAKQITVRIRQTKAGVKLAITDEGVGIAKADIGKLFQKFSRIPNPRSVAVGGTGLGLYWAKRIIELHGGTIEATSKVGQGTTFALTFPIS